jgi:tRNA(His) 5'-end guanylyltransferase
VSKLPIFKSRLATFDTRRIAPPAKHVDPYYNTPEHKAWRRTVMILAGWQCQWVEDGKRCQASARRGDRMFADHVEERSDGGTNDGQGMCLCGSHHSLKTARARGERARSSIEG